MLKQALLNKNMRNFLFLLCFNLILIFSAKAQYVNLKPGQTLSNISLRSTNGTIFDFNAQRNVKGFIVVFMTPSCDHCKMYEKRIIALDKAYKAKGYPVVAIGPYGDYPKEYPLDALPEMKKLAVKAGFTFPYLSDTKFRYTTMLGVQSTPTAVVLQKKPNGYLIVYRGMIDDQPNTKIQPKYKFVEQQVNKLLKP